MCSPRREEKEAENEINVKLRTSRDDKMCISRFSIVVTVTSDRDDRIWNKYEIVKVKSPFWKLRWIVWRHHLNSPHRIYFLQFLGASHRWPSNIHCIQFIHPFRISVLHHLSCAGGIVMSVTAERKSRWLFESTIKYKWMSCCCRCGCDNVTHRHRTINRREKETTTTRLDACFQSLCNTLWTALSVVCSPLSKETLRFFSSTRFQSSVVLCENEREVCSTAFALVCCRCASQECQFSTWIIMKQCRSNELSFLYSPPPPHPPLHHSRFLVIAHLVMA